MKERPLVSVVILARNAGPSFPDTLDALEAQRCDFPFEVLVVDSGSRDGTTQAALARGLRLHRIHPDEFDHGQTRNVACSLTRGDIVAFLVQDARPANEHWLDALTRTLRSDGRVAGAYGRVLPRLEAHPILRRSVLADPNADEAPRLQRLEAGERFFDLDPEERRRRANFNNVSSAIRRSVWTRIPFQRGEFAEDLGFGRATLEAGYALAYEPESVVLHSHAYGPRKIFQRTLADGRANRAILGRTCIDSAPRALAHAIQQVREDWRFLRRSSLSAASRLRAAGRSPALRAAEAMGLYLGGRPAPGPARSWPRIRPLEERPLRVLLVVHGFPPESVAGTEVYTVELARELRRRGHDVSIVHRSADRSLANYSIDLREWNGFPVYRIANHLEFTGIAETYHNTDVDEKFRWILGAVKPDVVHFQHALHLSTSCLRLARESGAAVVLTLHDYWFICPKVQLIRPDRSVCHLRRPGLGCVACASGRSAAIRVGKAITPVLGPALRMAVRVYGGIVRRTPRLGHRLLNDAVALERRTKSIRADVLAADVLLAPSAFLRRRYIAHGVPGDRITVCRNGIRVGPLRAVERSPSDVLRVGFTGSLVWWKGLEVLIEAFNRLPLGRARLDVHGDHDGNEALRTYHARLASRVTVPGVAFHGRYRTEHLPALYREIDVLVVPSLWFENSPLAVQEAFAARVPVVASRLGALQELVRDGVDGLLFEPGDPADLARVLGRLLEEPGLLERLRSQTPEVKDMDEHVTEILLLYRQFVARRIPTSSEQVAAIPSIEIWAPEFRRQEGSVRRQGRHFVLLEPLAKGRSSVEYGFELERPSTCRVEVETELLEGERGVVLAGLVTSNGHTLGEVPEHRFLPGEPLRRRHAFPIAARAGQNRICITNATASLPDRGRHHLRIRRVLVYEGRSNGGEPRP
jgi:glycosyltransferase involved in cell wall biosynthesis